MNFSLDFREISAHVLQRYSQKPSYRNNFMSTDEQMDKENVVYPYSGILFCLKRKEISTFLTTWVALEDVVLSEIRQTQ